MDHMGEFPACVEDGRVAGQFGALPFPDRRKKNKGVGDKNKEISPQKKNHLNV